MPINQGFLLRLVNIGQSMLGGFISENNSSTVCCAVRRTRSVLSIPAMLTPFTTALISSRKSVRTQRVGRIVGDARNQARDQNLAGDHASVQLIHRVLLNWLWGFVPQAMMRRGMDDVHAGYNRAAS